MKFSIVTPCFDRATYLDETLESVLTQKGDFEIEYIVQFSGGNANVEDVLARWETKVSSNVLKRKCRNIEFTVWRESDTNMYDGLNRGFQKATGDILAWINSDDLYHPGAFQTVAEIAREYPDVYWMSGIPNSFNSASSRTGFDHGPKTYSREFIKRGSYRIENLQYGFNWIAQDSCFWRRDLWNASGGRLDDSKGLAADFYLWQEFSKHADLVKVDSFLGGYRFHGDQFTADPESYNRCLPKLEPLPKQFTFTRNLVLRFSFLRRFLFNGRKGRPFLPALRLDWDWLIGRSLEWSFEENKWKLYHHPIF